MLVSILGAATALMRSFDVASALIGIESFPFAGYERACQRFIMAVM